jgi:hypothetical protein
VVQVGFISINNQNKDEQNIPDLEKINIKNGKKESYHIIVLIIEI